VASGKPFFAFVHKGSFPATFLSDLQYEDMLVFSADRLELADTRMQLVRALEKAIRNKDRYMPVSTAHPVFSQYTATAMTKVFTDTFQKIITHE